MLRDPEGNEFCVLRPRLEPGSGPDMSRDCFWLRPLPIGCAAPSGEAAVPA